ncbi:MAG: sensor histidine kinase [Comamonadaceae bacterium]|jgi:signal transduction histidine kinase|nr:sensor histidine kinase [Comamonadaceae bacterium]
MTPSAPTVPPRGLLQILLIAAALWALAAVLLFLVVPGIETLPRVLMFSECVGLTMVVVAMFLHRNQHFSRFKPAWRWLFRGLIAIPAGYFIGHQIAFLLLGEPMQMVGHRAISFIPILFTILVGGFGLHYYATREQLASEAAQRAEAQRLAVESQLRLLRTQLEPHMLFNTLANVRSLVREDAGRAEAMIDQLIVYLRSALIASQTDAVALSREFAQVRAYLDIMALRMGARLSYRLSLPQELEDLLVPPMLLQPLVENAIKHGLEPKVGGGSIEVEALRQDAFIELRVRDSGLGLPADGDLAPPGPATSTSYGLQHVRDRLHVTYGQAAELRLERRLPAGVNAVIRIPC